MVMEKRFYFKDCDGDQMEMFRDGDNIFIRIGSAGSYSRDFAAVVMSKAEATKLRNYMDGLLV